MTLIKIIENQTKNIWSIILFSQYSFSLYLKTPIFKLISHLFPFKTAQTICFCFKYKYHSFMHLKPCFIIWHYKIHMYHIHVYNPFHAKYLSMKCISHNSHIIAYSKHTRIQTHLSIFFIFYSVFLSISTYTCK